MGHEDQTREMAAIDPPTQRSDKKIRVLVAVACPNCHGTGRKWDAACSVCHGSKDLIERMDLTSFRKEMKDGD